MDDLVAVLDADVLVPILTCDLLLTAFEVHLYQPVVTNKILTEVQRNLLRAHPDIDPTTLRRRVEAMRRALRINIHADTEGGTNVAGINPKDRHVVAAALDAHAGIVVTNDRRLRREIAALVGPLRARSADAFAVELADRDRAGLERVVDDLIAKRIRRPVDRDGLIEKLAPAHPGLAAKLRATS